MLPAKMAEVLNSTLTKGGIVLVSTCEVSRTYRQKHAGYFFVKGGNLHVKHGRTSHCISCGERLMVGVKPLLPLPKTV